MIHGSNGFGRPAIAISVASRSVPVDTDVHRQTSQSQVHVDNRQYYSRSKYDVGFRAQSRAQ